MTVANATPRIDEVQSRPILVIERPPDRVVVVDHNRILDAHLLHGTAHVVDVVFERELGCVHADDDKPLAVLLRPGANIRKLAQPVDAGVGPEIDEHDFPGKAGRRQAWRVEPPRRTADCRQLTWRTLVRFHGTCPTCQGARPQPSLLPFRENVGGHGRFSQSRHLTFGRTRFVRRERFAAVGSVKLPHRPERRPNLFR